jgi:hypothetical protein
VFIAIALETAFLVTNFKFEEKNDFLLFLHRLCNRHERFGAMAAVTPQTILWEFARYYPAGSLVEAATAPSRRTLEAM